MITVDRNNFDLLKQRGNLDSVMLSQKLLDSRMANSKLKRKFQ